MKARGLNYGPSFQGLTEVYQQGTTLYGRVVLPQGVASRSPGTMGCIRRS